MIRCIVVTALFLISSCSNKESKIFPYDIYEKELSNGLKVIAIPFDSPGLVTYSTVVNVGSRNETLKGMTGFAHFFEHLMFYGTKKRNKAKADRLKKSLAAGGNAYTGDDHTVFYMTGNAEKIESFFDLNSDNIKHLFFSKAEFKREAGAILSEYRKNYSRWFRLMYTKLREVAFNEHSYSHSPIGYEEDILGLSDKYEIAWEFFSTFYRPENTALVIVGDINVEEVFTLSEKYYSDWQTGKHIVELIEEPEQHEERIAHINRAGELPTLMVGYKSPSYLKNQKESISLEIISEILSSKKSLLYQRLVNEEHKAKFFWAWNPRKIDPFVFMIVLRTEFEKESDLMYLKDELEKELETIKKVPQAKKFLNDIKSNIKYRFLSRLNNPQGIALRIAEMYQISGDPTHINTYFRLLDEITVDDIMVTARKYFLNQRRTIITMTDKEKGFLE